MLNKDSFRKIFEWTGPGDHIRPHLKKDWTTVDIRYYISSRCTAQWFDICIPYEMIIAVSLNDVTMQLLRCYWLRCLCCTLHIPVTYLSYDWKFVLLSPLRLFCLPLTPLPPGEHQSVLVSTSPFPFCWFFRFQVQVKSYDICLSDLFHQPLS